MTTLVTGGAGYIGSHTVRALREAGRDVVVLDTLELGRADAVLDAPLVVGDIHDAALVEQTCRDHGVTSLVHFAAYKSVGESMSTPSKYWHNNVDGTVTLVEAAMAAGVGEVVFSSSCSVYGTPAEVPVGETAAIAPESVYAESKATVERILGWYGVTHGLRAVSLRYFNAAGASFDARIGEDWTFSVNLVPLVMKAVLGAGPPVKVFGTDYPTPDGTCIRDYIHVDDLADAHLKALDHLAGRRDDDGRQRRHRRRFVGAGGHRRHRRGRRQGRPPRARRPTGRRSGGDVRRSDQRRSRCSGGRPGHGLDRDHRDRLPLARQGLTAVRPSGRRGRGRASRRGWRSPGGRGAGGGRRRRGG